MIAKLRTYDNEAVLREDFVEVDDLHDFSAGPYQDTVPFAVGSNQTIVPVESVCNQYILDVILADLESLPQKDFLALGSTVTVEQAVRALRLVQSQGTAKTYNLNSEVHGQQTIGASRLGGAGLPRSLRPETAASAPSRSRSALPELPLTCGAPLPGLPGGDDG